MPSSGALDVATVIGAVYYCAMLTFVGTAFGQILSQRQLVVSNQLSSKTPMNKVIYSAHLYCKACGYAGG